MKKINRNAKIEKLTKKVGRGVRLIVIGPFGYEIMWHLQKEGLDMVSKSFNPFWKNEVQAWVEITNISATAPETILAQPLWYNKQIKIDNKSVFNKKNG